LDLKGTEDMLVDLYDALDKKAVVLVNKFSPEMRLNSDENNQRLAYKLKRVLKHPIIGIIPCYCDVLQTERTELIALTKPHHPFVKNLTQIAQKLIETLQE
jgi:hypothetical protein